MKVTLTEQATRKLAAEAMVDPRTVAKIYDGQVSKPLIRERVVEAAKRLKMPAPPAMEDK